jgi:phosphoglycerate dehydrogenase-like enzyme
VRRQPCDVVVPLWSLLDAETIAAGHFGLIQQFGAGVERIDIAAATENGVQVANMPGLNAPDVAEHTLLLLLALARSLPNAADGFLPGRWGDPPGRGLMGCTVCILGLGAVGSEVAKRLAPFEVRMVGVRRDPSRGGPVHAPGIEVLPSERLHDALAIADAVIVAATPAADGRPLIDRDALTAMKPGGLLINVARGSLIDEDALLQALDSGQLAAAGLDVFATEPYPHDAPLINHPRVLATAHNAALTSGYFHRGVAALGDALLAYVAGQPPANALNAPAQPRRGTA